MLIAVAHLIPSAVTLALVGLLEEVAFSNCLSYALFGLAAAKFSIVESVLPETSLADQFPTHSRRFLLSVKAFPEMKRRTTRPAPNCTHLRWDILRGTCATCFRHPRTAKLASGSSFARTPPPYAIRRIIWVCMCSSFDLQIAVSWLTSSVSKSQKHLSLSRSLRLRCRQCGPVRSRKSFSRPTCGKTTSSKTFEHR